MLDRSGIPVGINGIGGRIGGNALRVMIEHPDLKFNVIAGNDIGLDRKDPAGNFVQIKAHDSTFGPWPCRMSVDQGKLLLETRKEAAHITLFSERDPANIFWGQKGIKGIAECTGVFRSRATDGNPGYDSHLSGGAKCVALSAPAKDDVLTVVYGVHEKDLSKEPLLSGASCTSGSIAFPLKALLSHKEEWGFNAGFICTVHAYTAGEQGLQDQPKHITPGSRRMFAGPVNIIPTTTGAAKAIPNVDGLGEGMAGIPFDGYALRVPVISGSATLLNVTLAKEPPLEEVLQCFRSLAAQRKMNGKFAVNEDPHKHVSGLPLVSSAIIARPESSIIDVENCLKQGSMYSFLCWYGNEWGYVYRLVEALHEQCS
ncbi:MAG: glyceraldehyde 3-phosphate dehydrogenase NAD-binding domain-containing protein [Patescibacteria group bacterium]